MSMNKSYIDNDKDHGHLLIYTALLAKKIFFAWLSFLLCLPTYLVTLHCLPNKKEEECIFALNLEKKLSFILCWIAP